MLSSIEYSATLAVLPWDAGATLRDCSLAAAAEAPPRTETRYTDTRQDQAPGETSTERVYCIHGSHHCQSPPNWRPWSFPLITQEPFLITLNSTTHPHVFPWRPKCCRMPLSGSSVFIAALNKIDQLTINILNANQPVSYIVFCPKCRVVEEFNLHLDPSLLGNIK